MLPPEVCSDADLAAIADGRPTTPAELATLTSMGPLTAARLFPSIGGGLDDDPEAGSQAAGLPPPARAIARRLALARALRSMIVHLDPIGH